MATKTLEQRKFKEASVEEYCIIENKELLHEAFAGLLADISRMVSQKGISSVKRDSLCILEEMTAAIWRDILGSKYSSVDDIIKLKGQYDFIKAYLQRMA